MVEKITCPECNAEFDLDEGYKKHLEDLKAKTRAEVEKKIKDSAKSVIQKYKEKTDKWTKEKIKAEKEKAEIGRASCREREQISVVAVSLKKKKKKIKNIIKG